MFHKKLYNLDDLKVIENSLKDFKCYNKEIDFSLGLSTSSTVVNKS